MLETDKICIGHNFQKLSCGKLKEGINEKLLRYQVQYEHGYTARNQECTSDCLQDQCYFLGCFAHRYLY